MSYIALKMQNLVGLHIVAASTKHTCLKVTTFVANLNWDLGIYGHVRPSINLHECFVSGSKVGILINSFGPDPAQHMIERKSISIFDSVIVGVPQGTSCSRLAAPPSKTFRSFSAHSPRFGLVLSSFTQHQVEPASQIMDTTTSYPAVGGG